jgi:di/tricarboxylate transporter
MDASARSTASSSKAEEKHSTPYFRVRLLGVVAALAALNFYALSTSDTYVRGSCLIAAVLAMQVSGLLPLYCIGLLVPVFATVFRAIPGRTPSEAAKQCFGSMFNPMTAVVLGSFTVNAICLKCSVERRVLAMVARRYMDRPKFFLLALMLACMFCSAVVMVTLLALAAVRPLSRKAPGKGGASLILGVGISCTIGGVLTPISGPPALILLSVLAEYGAQIEFLEWVLIATPTMICVCIAAFLVLLAVFGAPPAPDPSDFPEPEPLTRTQCFFLGLCPLFLVGCMAEDWLTPVIGDSGNLGLLLTAAAFAGFLTKRDFLTLPWDLLALLFGVNALAFVLKESGLARELAATVMPTQVYDVWLWFEILKLTAIATLISCVMPHSVVATLGLPVVVAFGFQLYAPTMIAVLVLFGIACGVGTPYSSSDMIMAVETVDDEQDEQSNAGDAATPLAGRKDFYRGGLAVAVAGWAIVNSVGFGVSIGVLGMPPRHIIIEAPAELIPSVEPWNQEKATRDKLESLESRLEELEGFPEAEPAPSAPASPDGEWGEQKSSQQAFANWGPATFEDDWGEQKPSQQVFAHWGSHGSETRTTAEHSMLRSHHLRLLNHRPAPRAH